MMMKEFETRTGFYPMPEEYKEIEEEYYASKLDKDAFCKEFLENQGIVRFMRRREKQIVQMHKTINDLNETYQKQIDKLKKQLDKELEWKPYEIEENVSEADYQQLKNSMSTREWNEVEAKIWLADAFGFSESKIRILHEVSMYECNRHKRLREIGKYERKPLYNASDWNYIRFDCGYMCYELQNGELRFFSS